MKMSMMVNQHITGIEGQVRNPHLLITFWRTSQLIITTGNMGTTALELAEEMPALWPNLIDILNVENSKYLPVDVASIIIKLIEIRRNTFLNAAVRSEDDYVDWEDPDMEHPTQFYPNWKIWRYPKKYVVRNVSDW